MSQKKEDRPPHRAVRRTFEFSEEERDFLEYLAERRGTNLSQEVRRGIRLLHLIEKRKHDGGRIFLEKDGSMAELEVV